MAFDRTRWTLVQAAQAGDDAAVRELVRRYRDPVVAYIERRGFRSDAEDLAQEVFARLLGKGALARANPGRGHFRSLLVTVTEHVIVNHVKRETARKRGGGAVQLLGDADADVAAAAPDDEFDREWLSHIVGLAFERLSREFPAYHEAVWRFHVEGHTQGEVARSLGCSTAAVKKHVHRGRQKLLAYLREEVWNYASSGEECVEEVRQLSRFLPP